MDDTAQAPPAKVSVVDGSVAINTIWLVADTPQARVWTIDFKTKYPEINHYEENSVVAVVPSERTPPDQITTLLAPTLIYFAVPAGWYLIAEAGRYTIYVAAFDAHAELARVWPED